MFLEMWCHHLIVHKVNMICICIFLKTEDAELGVNLYLVKIGIYHTSELYSHEINITFWAENPTIWETAKDRNITTLRV